MNKLRSVPRFLASFRNPLDPIIISYREMGVNIGLLAAMIGLVMIPKIGALVAMGLLMIISLTSVFNAVRTLSVLFLIIYLNAFLNIQTGPMMIMRWGVFFAACGRIYMEILNNGASIYSFVPVRYLHGFCLIAFFCNLGSLNVDVTSYLKLFSFAFGTTAIFVGMAFCERNKDRLVIWLLSIGVFLTVASIPMLSTEAGYFSKARSLEINELGTYIAVDPELVGGFMGILGHAQSFGVVAALFAILLITTIFVTKFDKKFLLSGVLFILAVMLFMSKTRTAGLAFMITSGLILLLLNLQIFRGYRVIKGVKIPLLPFFVFIAGLILLAVISGGVPGLGFLQRFISKGASEDLGLLEAYQNSRGHLMSLGWNNFKDNPLFGIGFAGDSWDPDGVLKRESARGLLGLAYAPTEKGMIVTAVLEETGAIGFIAFMGMIICLYFQFFRRANIYAIAILTCILLLNMGEMNFFSMGGIGTLQWIFLGAASILGDRSSIPMGGPPLGRQNFQGQKSLSGVS